MSKPASFGGFAVHHHHHGWDVCVHLPCSCLLSFAVLLARPCHGCPLLVELQDRLFVRPLSARVFQVMGNIQRCRWVCDSGKPSSVECTLKLEPAWVWKPTHAASSMCRTVSIFWILTLPNNGCIALRFSRSRPGVLKSPTHSPAWFLWWKADADHWKCFQKLQIEICDTTLTSIESTGTVCLLFLNQSRSSSNSFSSSLTVNATKNDGNRHEISI